MRDRNLPLQELRRRRIKETAYPAPIRNCLLRDFMGRAWQFFLTVAVTIALLAYFYYSSDYYAKRAAAPAGGQTPIGSTAK
jgi:hypothetical protein